MLSALISQLGTSAAGALLGQVSSIFQKRADAKILEEKHKHERDLAYYDKLKEVNESRHENNPGLSRTINLVVLMLAFVYGSAILICFTNPSEVIYTLDPAQGNTKIGIPWLFMWEFKPEKIIKINMGGVGYGLLYPINFILSYVCVGVISKRVR